MALSINDELGSAGALKFLVSKSLFSVASSNPNWSKASQLAAGGFKDTTRLASGNPKMHTEIVMANRDNILLELGQFQNTLSNLKQKIEDGNKKELTKLFTETKRARDTWQRKFFPI